MKQNPSQLKILFRECSNSGTVQDRLDQQIFKTNNGVENHAMIIVKILPSVIYKTAVMNLSVSQLIYFI